MFRQPDKKFGLTVRSDGAFSTSTVRIGDVPRGTVPTAVWHTHLPSSAGTTSLAQQIFRAILTSFDLGWDEFSTEDRTLANDATQASLKLYGHPISIYLATATVIRRYRPTSANPEKSWAKEAPSRMRAR